MTPKLQWTFDFYPRPPRGGRPHRPAHRRDELHFYPRPPRGGRRTPCRRSLPRLQFLSTPSARRATMFLHGAPEPPAISIHALREEGDELQIAARPSCSNFYPRPPRGGRRGQTIRQSFPALFLSTPSARRATSVIYLDRPRFIVFLSTPSARRATKLRLIRIMRVSYFYPRPPRGGRLLPGGWAVGRFLYFYPRPPRGGRRRATGCAAASDLISIHALREEGDRAGRRRRW